MQENIKLIDLIIELVDARVPLSSRNPDIDELGKNKARLILLNKADLAEDRRNDEWLEYFKEKGYSAVKVNSRKGGGIKSIQNVIQEACKEKMERDRKRGILNRPVRAMVVGIPNVGKSTFINSLAGKACAKTGNKPGVTKGKQWIRLNKNVELLDTPGILWPKFEDQAVGLKLAFIGSIKDEILQTEELASELVDFINHDNGISVFLIHGFNQLQDLFGSIVVQSTGWLIAEQDIRVLYDRTSNGSTLLLTTGKLIGEFTLMICKTKCIKKFIHIQGMVA